MEEHHDSGSKKVARNLKVQPKILAMGAAAVGIAIASFFGGVAYQKGHNSNSTAATGYGQLGASRSRFTGQRPTIGTVTAVSSTSISVQNARTNAVTTLAITSATQITDNGSTVTATDIQVGDSVLVRKSTSNSQQAASIDVNPSFGGGMGSPGAGVGTDPSVNSSGSI